MKAIVLGSWTEMVRLFMLWNTKVSSKFLTILTSLFLRCFQSAVFERLSFKDSLSNSLWREPAWQAFAL